MVYVVWWMTLSVPLSAGCQLVFYRFPSPPPPSVYPLVFNSCGVRCSLG